jgi:hypothetical protein
MKTKTLNWINKSITNLNANKRLKLCNKLPKDIQKRKHRSNKRSDKIKIFNGIKNQKFAKAEK